MKEAYWLFRLACTLDRRNQKKKRETETEKEGIGNFAAWKPRDVNETDIEQPRAL